MRSYRNDTYPLLFVCKAGSGQKLMLVRKLTFQLRDKAARTTDTDLLIGDGLYFISRALTMPVELLPSEEEISRMRQYLRYKYYHNREKYVVAIDEPLVYVQVLEEQKLITNENANV